MLLYNIVRFCRLAYINGCRDYFVKMVHSFVKMAHFVCRNGTPTTVEIVHYFVKIVHFNFVKMVH